MQRNPDQGGCNIQEPVGGHGEQSQGDQQEQQATLVTGQLQNMT